MKNKLTSLTVKISLFLFLSIIAIPNSFAWEFINPLINAREGLSAVVLDGKIYAIGGNSVPGVVFSSVECYDPVTGQWSEVAPLNHQRTFAAAAAANGKIFVFGGRSDAAVLQTEVEMFDSISQSWTVVDTMDYPREGLTATTVGDKIWVTGGYSNALGFSDLVQIFDPAAMSFESMQPEYFISPGRVGHAADTYGDEVHIIGGVYYNAIDYHDVWIDGLWIEQTPIPSIRFNSEAVFVGESLYVAGGSNEETLNTVEIFNRASGDWIEGMPMLHRRDAFGMVYLNGLLYSIGGFGGEDSDFYFLSSVETLDVTSSAGTNKSDPIVENPKITIACSPNPFNSSVNIEFSGPRNNYGIFNASIYDINGRIVWSWENISANTSGFIWNGENLQGSPVSSGVYYVAMSLENYIVSKSIILLK